jgi:hypothetical protein
MLKLIYNTDFNNSMKINTIFLLTAVGVFATFSLFTLLTTATNFNAAAQSNETAVTSSNETDSNPDFYANFTAPVMVSNSKATGNATFTLGDGGETMYFVISGNGLQNITQAVILQSTGGRTTDLVSLYYAPTSGLITTGSGTADGNFTSADFVNILQGEPMTELVKKIIDGEVFIAIKSVPFPLGEIAGKIQPVK